MAILLLVAAISRKSTNPLMTAQLATHASIAVLVHGRDAGRLAVEILAGRQSLIGGGRELSPGERRFGCLGGGGGGGGCDNGSSPGN